MSELTWCHRWSKWKAKGGTINLCEMLRVNLHVLRLLQYLMTALQMAYHENIKNITHKYFPLFVICQQEFFFCVNHLNIFFFLCYFILFYNNTWHSLTIQLHGTYLQQDYKIYLCYSFTTYLNIFHNWFLHHFKRPWTSLKLILQKSSCFNVCTA